MGFAGLHLLCSVYSEMCPNFYANFQEAHSFSYAFAFFFLLLFEPVVTHLVALVTDVLHLIGNFL